MKLRGEIIGLETTGDQIVVRINANEVQAAEWRSGTPVEIRLSDTARHRDALRIGRAIELELRYV